MKEKGIEIIKDSQDKRIAISQEGLEIRREGKSLSFEVMETGYVYLVVDRSESMSWGDKLNQAKKGAINFAKEARNKEYLIGLIQFESFATHLCEPVRDISILKRHLENMRAGGFTNMAEAIQIANQNLQNKKGFRVMVIVTDGEPTYGEPTPEEATLKAAKEAKIIGIDIITIGTDDADREFLKELASRTNLGVKVSREQFGKAITSAAKMLPQLEHGRKRR